MLIELTFEGRAFSQFYFLLYIYFLYFPNFLQRAYITLELKVNINIKEVASIF